MTHRLLPVLATACVLGWPPATLAADAPATKTAPKPSPSRQQADDKARGMAVAREAVQRISEAQLVVADRVLTGRADCEFNQSVDVDPIAGQPGHFRVAFKKSIYTMIPEETTTGAVRLEDKKAGVIWLQIPSKSMLMNAKLGQRVVDSCLHSEQKAAVTAVEAAGRSTAPAGTGLGVAPAAGASDARN